MVRILSLAIYDNNYYNKSELAVQINKKNQSGLTNGFNKSVDF